MELQRSRGGLGLRIESLNPVGLHMSVTHYRDEDLYQAADTTELIRQPGLVVHLDVAHRGVGTASCGPDVDPEFLLPSGDFRFAYRLSMIS
jgi:beta-galactosidase